MKLNNFPLVKTKFLVKKYLLLAVATGFIATAALIVYFFTVPKFNEISEIEENIKRDRSELLILTKKKQVLASLSDNELEDYSLKAVAALPTEKSFPGLYSGLDLLVSQVGGKLISFDAAPGLVSSESAKAGKTKADQEEKLPNKLRYLSAKAGLSISPHDLADLVDKLARSSRLVEISDLLYKEEASIVSNRRQNTAINLRVYYQLAEENQLADIVALTDEEKKIIAKVDSFNQFIVPLLPPSFRQNLFRESGSN